MINFYLLQYGSKNRKDGEFTKGVDVRGKWLKVEAYDLIMKIYEKNPENKNVMLNLFPQLSIINLLYFNKEIVSISASPLETLPNKS